MNYNGNLPISDTRIKSNNIFLCKEDTVLNQKYLATFEIHVPVKFNVLMQIFIRLFQAIYIYWKHDCLALHKLFIVNLYLCLCRKQLKTTWSFWHHIFADVTTDVNVNSSSWKFLSFLKSYNLVKTEENNIALLWICLPLISFILVCF